MGCGSSSDAAAQPKAADIKAAAPDAHSAATADTTAGGDTPAGAGSKKARKPVTLDDDSPPSSPGLSPRPAPAADTPGRAPQATAFNSAAALPRTPLKEPAAEAAPTSSVKKGRGEGRRGSVTGNSEKKKAKPKETDDGEDAETEALRQKILAQTDDLDKDDGSHTARGTRRPSHAHPGPAGSKQAAAAAASAAEKAEKEKKKAAERAEKERKERKKEEKRARRRASATGSDEGHEEDEEKQHSSRNTARSSGESTRSARSPPTNDDSADFGRSTAAPIERWTVGQSSLPNSARKPAVTATTPTKPPAPVLQLPSWQIGFDAEKFRKANDAAASPSPAPASAANTQRSMVDHTSDDVDLQISTARSVGRSQESYVPPSLIPALAKLALQPPAASSFGSTSTSRGPLSSSSNISMAPTTVLSHEDEALLDDLLNED